MQEKLTLEEQKVLLRLAREAMERGVKGEQLPSLDPSSLPLALRAAGLGLGCTLLTGSTGIGSLSALLLSGRSFAENVPM